VLQILDFPARGAIAPADIGDIGDWAFGIETAFLTKHGSDLGKLNRHSMLLIVDPDSLYIEEERKATTLLKELCHRGMPFSAHFPEAIQCTHITSFASSFIGL